MGLDEPQSVPVAEKSDTKDSTSSEDEPPSARAIQIAWWFGGKNTVIGPRIAPVLEHLRSDESELDDSASAILTKQKELEDGHAIQYRTCSWQKARCS